jgi:hypothetical protein
MNGVSDPTLSVATVVAHGELELKVIQTSSSPPVSAH